MFGVLVIVSQLLVSYIPLGTPRVITSSKDRYSQHDERLSFSYDSYHQDSHKARSKGDRRIRRRLSSKGESKQKLADVTLDYENLRWDWEHLIDQHNRKYYWNLTEHIYRNTKINDVLYPISSYAHALKPELLSNGFLVNGSWDRLRHRFFFKLKEAINEKLSSHTRHDKSKNERRKVTFNVLVTGGSVPSGHGCLTLEPMEWFEKNNIPVSEEEHEGMHRWCSWPRRFIETFQYAINRLTHSLHEAPLLTISPRFCTAGGCTTICSIENVKSGEFRGYHCFNNIDSYNWPEDTGTHDDWQPDLVIWDHGVNDNNDRFFLRMARHDAYQSFVELYGSLPSRPQILTLSLQHGYQKDANAERDRVEMNSKWNIPYFAYDKMFDNINEPIQENTPFHSAAYPEHHPSFPTHSIWSQLVIFMLINPNVIPPDGIVQYGSEEIVSDDSKYQDLDESLFFCPDNFTTRYDFSGGVSAEHFIRGVTGDSAIPITVSGNWSLGYDTIHKRIDASGWIYQSPAHDSTGQRESSRNNLLFRCHNPRRGDVEIGYLASYSSNWGMANVTLTTYYDDQNIASSYGIIDSRWNLTFSVPQDFEISSGNKDFKIINYVDVNIEVVSGQKFKVISLSCC